MVKKFTSNKQIGNIGENIAKEYLISKGFEILDFNFRYSKFSEIDIIALKNNTIHFVEVKTRTQIKFGEPIEAVNRKKLESIFQCGMFYLKNNSLRYDKMQIDIIGILLNKNENPEIKFFENISL